MGHLVSLIERSICTRTAIPMFDLPTIHLRVAIYHTFILLTYLSIEKPICCFLFPYCSVDCSMAWNLRKLVPCMIANSAFQDVSWTFNKPVFLQVKNPFLILSLWLLPQERGGMEMENWSEILVDKDVFQFPICRLSLNAWRFRCVVCHMRDNRREQFPHLVQAAT